MYQQLLCAAGGGIVSPRQQAEQNEAATILIGLGGTGINCLRVLKKEIFDRLRPDDPNSPYPTYQHIKFLAVDTDQSSLTYNGTLNTLDENTEFFDISCQDITSVLGNDSILRIDPALQWLKASSTQPRGSGIQILNVKAGACGVRQIGRLLLIRKSSDFVSKLNDLIIEAKKGLSPGSPLNIHIFTGMSGGTGAGTFLDVCYLVQYTLEQMGLDGEAQTCGFFFLPDVNLSNPGLNGATRQYIKSNGFASMKELDHCMNFDTNGDEWNQQYNGFSICTERQPVDLAFLLSATDANGHIPKNSYQYAMHAATDFVMEFLTKPFIPDGDGSASENAFTIESIISNMQTMKGITEIKHGGGYEYCLIGSSNVHVPYKSVTTFWESRSFEDFGNLQHQVPTKQDITEFLKSTNMTLLNLDQQVKTDLPAVPMLEIDSKELNKELYNDVQGITDPHLLPGIFGSMRRVAYETIPGILERNKKNMLQGEIKVTAGNANATFSLIPRILTKLIKIAAQPDRGPYFAGAILHSDKDLDMGNVLSEYQVQVDKMYLNAKTDLSLRTTELEQTLNKLQQSNRFNRGGTAKEYQQAVHAYFVKTVEIKEYETLLDVIVRLQKQVENLYNNFFEIFRPVMYVLNDILIGQSEANSVPLFWFNGAFSINPASQIELCSVPYGSSIIALATQIYQQDHIQVSIRPSYSKDRISILKIQFGVPMFAYKGAEEYRNVPSAIGTYLYEGAVGDPRDWRKLREIRPYSIIPINQRSEEDQRRAFIVDQAIEKGLFYHQQKDDPSSDYELIELDVTAMEQQLSWIKQAIESGDLEKIKHVKNEIGKNLYPGKIRYFPRTGAKGYEDIVAKDLLIASDGRIRHFEKDINLLNQRDQLLKES